MDIDKELDALFDDPMFDLSPAEKNLFDIPSDMKRVMDNRRVQPDHYAQRKPCADFELYRAQFALVQEELKTGKRSLKRIGKTSNLQAGEFFVVSGQLVLLQSIGKETKSSNGLRDARTRCIFEDGTESDILLQTLRTNVVNDGYGVVNTQEKLDSAIESSFTEGDKSTGFVYVLKSLSANPEIANVENLYKIGFTTDTVENRIANAIHEPTYLMAPVHIVLAAEIINMNSHIFESLVHQIFDAVNFKVKVFDDEGVEHIPSEWYVAPIEIIELVIKKIADGSIVNYTYNAEMQCLEKRIVKSKSSFDTSGLKVLTLNIKDVYFKEILSGEKKIEYRELKQSTLNKFTYIDEADNKRYLRRYDVIRFFVGYHQDRDSALVAVEDTTYDSDSGLVEFHLGTILEHVK